MKAALEQVREGRVYDLGRVLDERAPVFPGRHFRPLLVPNTMPIGGLSWVADIVSTTTQVGTHLDARRHRRVDVAHRPRLRRRSWTTTT